MYSAYKLNKQGDNIQPWRTPFPIWNHSVDPCPVLTVASWPTYRFLKKQVRWSGIPISFRIFCSLLWSTQKTIKEIKILRIWDWDTVVHPQFSSVQLLSRVRLFETPWSAARQASLSITNSRSLLKLLSIESVMPSNHLILCHPLLLLPSIFPSIRVFSNESALYIKWPEYWSFSFNISPREV